MAEHYKGMTSQNEDFEFDVASDGMSLSNIVTGQVNESCDPDTLGLYGGNLPGGGALIDSPGTSRSTSRSTARSPSTRTRTRRLTT
jgi:hypothetical protein